jgi:hypothetical protein
VRVYRGAGEATATLGWGPNPEPAAGGRAEGEGCSAGVYPADPLTTLDPEPLDRPDNARRATSRLRRFLVENVCDRLITLTYANQTDDLGYVLRTRARFLRRLRERHPELVYATVIERHKSGMLHVHVAVNRWVPKDELQSLWGRGWVDVRRLRAKSGTRPGREGAAMAARYLSKYVVKDPVRSPGGHRYEVRQGFQPESTDEWVDGLDPITALELVAASIGAALTYRWSSAGVPDWRGPPAAFATW